VDQRSPHKTRDTETNRGESGEEPQTHGTGEKFLNRTPMTYALRSRIDKWDLIKLQSFCKAKDTVNRTKWLPPDWEKHLYQSYI
jgi:phage-related protein